MYQAKWRIDGLGFPVLPGTIIEELDAATARILLDCGAIVPYSAPPPQPPPPPPTEGETGEGQTEGETGEGQTEGSTQFQLPPEVLAMTKAQLQTYASETYGLTLSTSMTKEQMLAAIATAAEAALNGTGE